MAVLQAIIDYNMIKSIGKYTKKYKKLIKIKKITNMENSNQKIYYSHTTKFEPVQWGVSPKATVALTLSEDGDLVFYGMTICSKDDNFSRKQGRELAEQRLKNNFGTLIVPENMKKLSRHQICLNLVRELTYSVILKPRRWKRKITRHNILVLVNNEQKTQ